MFLYVVLPISMVRFVNTFNLQMLKVQKSKINSLCTNNLINLFWFCSITYLAWHPCLFYSVWDMKWQNVQNRNSSINQPLAHSTSSLNQMLIFHQWNAVLFKMASYMSSFMFKRLCKPWNLTLRLLSSIITSTLQSVFTVKIITSLAVLGWRHSFNFTNMFFFN